MLFLKLWYHFCAAVSKLFFKLIYGRKLDFGKKVTWRRSLCIMIDKNAEVKIGNNCFFNNYCSVNANKRITIGDGCLFGENVKIYDHNHRFKDKNIPIKEQGFSNGTVEIGNHCWIGSNVILLKGTKIGDHCIIGAGCVIRGEIPPGTIVKNTFQLIHEQIR